ncbi:hypothetical protein IDJ75_16415 [Mucilaginibacter rigui]|uniref:Uncharacterized protein n=1 Tax=Mucilaginibacter rigui TaxID=534635 RepID=A0ABR7X9R1_9SPHI|nr:hypothetical protein [Mucilaginibacter rigui]MBD1386870.1 hypothetical protein [Mucilaginibacter rigui]
MKKIGYIVLSVIVIGVSACQKENTAPTKKTNTNSLESTKSGFKAIRDTVPPDPHQNLIKRDTVPPDPLTR